MSRVGRLGRLGRLTDGGAGVAGAGSPRGTERVEVPVAVVLDLLAAAGTAGAAVPSALVAVGRAVDGARGRALVAAGEALAWGASWEEAWATAPWVLDPVARALRPAWVDGAPPAAALRAAGEQLRRDHQATALEAAARLGVRLVLPLGLCALPAFVLVGLVPVLLSLVGSGAR